MVLRVYQEQKQQHQEQRRQNRQWQKQLFRIFSISDTGNSSIDITMLLLLHSNVDHSFRLTCHSPPRIHRSSVYSLLVLFTYLVSHVFMCARAGTCLRASASFKSLKLTAITTWYEWISYFFSGFISRDRMLMSVCTYATYIYGVLHIYANSFETLMVHSPYTIIYLYDRLLELWKKRKACRLWEPTKLVWAWLQRNSGTIEWHTISIGMPLVETVFKSRTEVAEFRQTFMVIYHVVLKQS